MNFLSRLCASNLEGSSAIEELDSQQRFSRLPTPVQLEVAGWPDLDLDTIPLSQHHTQIAQVLRSFTPSTCRWLSLEDIRLIGSRPIAAGGFTDIFEAVYDGGRVILKSYRRYVTSDIAGVAKRFYNEVRICSLLQHTGIGQIPFVGVYSTELHPFCLVYKYMSGLDLRQHLKNHPSEGRLNLLMGIAQSLSHMHDLGIVHDGLKTTNVLVDDAGTTRISGLGNAYLFHHSIPATMELSGESATQLSHSNVPELTGPGIPLNVINSSYPTKSSDMYNFGVIAFEVLTGRPPFSEQTEIAATYSMLKGDRPSRPDDGEISDQLWSMIERCWDVVPSHRMSAREVIVLLETELQHTLGFQTLSYS